MVFLSISIYVYKKYRYEINQSGKKVETSLAQPEAWAALLLILVGVTVQSILKKALWLIIKEEEQQKKPMTHV